jgi:hypothetical protein
MGFEWVPGNEWSDSQPSAQLPAATRTVLSADAVHPGFDAPDCAGPAGEHGGAQRHGRHARAAGGAVDRASDRSGHRRPSAGPAAWRRYLHFR